MNEMTDKTMTLDRWEPKDAIEFAKWISKVTPSKWREFANHLSQPAERPCSLSEALNVIEHWGRRGNTLQSDDVNRLRALTDKIAPAERVRVPSADDIYEVVRGFGYTTRGQSDEIAEALHRMLSAAPEANHD